MFEGGTEVNGYSRVMLTVEWMVVEVDGSGTGRKYYCDCDDVLMFVEWLLCVDAAVGGEVFW
jgi:hypothetical protein